MTAVAKRVRLTSSITMGGTRASRVAIFFVPYWHVPPYSESAAFSAAERCAVQRKSFELRLRRKD
jgi:hypothetical protein